MRDMFRPFHDGALDALRNEQKLLRSVLPSSMEQMLKSRFTTNLGASVADATSLLELRQTKQLSIGLVDAAVAAAAAIGAKEQVPTFGIAELAADISLRRLIPRLEFEPLATAFAHVSEMRALSSGIGLLGGLGEQLSRLALPRFSVVDDILRTTRHLDAALVGRPCDSSNTVAEMAVGALRMMDIRTFNAAMPLSGALRFASELLPETPLDLMMKGLAQVQARPLGLASFAVGRLSRPLSSLSAQALGALTVRELGVSDAILADSASPLTLKLFEVQAALDGLPGAIASALNALPDEIADAIRKSIAQQPTVPQWASPQAQFLVAVISLLVAIISLALSLYQATETGRAAPIPQEAAYRAEQMRTEAGRIEPVLAELLDLQRDLARIPDTSPAADPGPCIYIVQRTVVVRASSRRDSKRLAVLHPGDVVQVIDQTGRQLRVRSCDFVRRDVIIGWALKKYFERP